MSLIQSCGEDIAISGAKSSGLVCLDRACYKDTAVSLIQSCGEDIAMSGTESFSEDIAMSGRES